MYLTNDSYRATEPDYGDEPMIEDEVADLMDELDRLAQKAETSEQWAEICRIEAVLVEMKHRDNGRAA